MRTAVFGVLVIAGLTSATVAVTPGDSRVFDERFVAFSTTVENKYEQLTVIDPARRVILVYHVQLASGEVELRCVRNIESDLQLDYYNGKQPLPPEIRSQLGIR
jgi:hypothetical protein